MLCVKIFYFGRLFRIDNISVSVNDKPRWVIELYSILK